MPDIDYNQKYLEMVNIAVTASQYIRDDEVRYIAFEKVLDDQLARFYEETNNQKGDK